ncbi:hypothetical protein [Posidoniimonas polymericola]|uniref:hypothetical protein n=1 Tax=Posidoniimonas polymericola TaxID=2528002 RepID=UPI001E511474|nr:hypothetical protein [Posidoniimonas polymericola]
MRLDRTGGAALITQLARVTVHAVGRDISRHGEAGVLSNPFDEPLSARDMLIGSPRRAKLAFVVRQMIRNGLLRLLADRVQHWVNHAIATQGRVGFVLAGDPLGRRLVACSRAL